MPDYTYCDNCDNEIPLVHFAEIGEGFQQVESGLSLNLSGHYGGFNDGIGAIDPWTILCHECSLKLWEAIPKAVERYGTMLHPYEGERCCRFGWSIEDVRRDAEKALRGEK